MGFARRKTGATCRENATGKRRCDASAAAGVARYESRCGRVRAAAGVAHLLPVELPDLIERVNRRREAAMHAEYLILHQRCQRHVVKQVGEYLPDVGVAILAQALVVEAVDLRDLSALVVASEEMYPLRVAHCARRWLACQYAAGKVHPRAKHAPSTRRTCHRCRVRGGGRAGHGRGEKGGGAAPPLSVMRSVTVSTE